MLKVTLKCPYCKKSLMDKEKLVDGFPSVKVLIQFENKRSLLYLSSLYGSYNIESEIEIPQNQIVTFFCPHCNSVLSISSSCETCKAPMVSFEFIEGSKLQICSRKGCKKHLIEFEDLEKEMSAFYNYYSVSTSHAVISEREKITTLEPLREKIYYDYPKDMPLISISAGTCGLACGSSNIIKAFKEGLKKFDLKGKVKIRVTGCHGFCQAEPNVILYPEGIFYRNLKVEDVEEIIKETIIGKKIIERLVYKDEDQKIYPYFNEIPIYKKQFKLILNDNPLIDPTDINTYLAIGGYKILEKVIATMSPEKVIEEVKKSGLRGRGGAGFPTGFKWDFCRRAEGDIKYVICNADEGDPGAYMDRSLLEGNPHSVIEGIIIGGYAIGAKEGWIYVRNEYPLAIKHIMKAIEQAKRLHLIGENILGSGFNFDLKVAQGAGAFVCGEETALIASIEGGRGIPRQRPPFPAKSGLYGKPTNINNVETWANIPKILDKGGDWFASFGTQMSKGTKIFSLVGKIKNTGLVEVPMGITLNEIIYDIGGGSPTGKKIKAVQTGGPSGGCIPPSLFNLPVDYESLISAGAIMGSGGMIVMDEDTCMVDIAKYFTNFLQEESCGKCSTCREGTQRMYEILTRITDGEGKEEDLILLEELAHVIKDASMCGLGQTAPNPVLSTLRHFRNEYIEHIKHKRCSAVVCKEIISSPCHHVCPIGTEASTYIALISQGRYEEALRIIKKDNPLASVLSRVCHHPCETKCRSGQGGGEPISIRSLKRFVTDYGLKHGLMVKAPHFSKNGQGKVAIVGSGPAGLTCAFYLAQKGYETTVFEKLPIPGGMLVAGIPGYRLPREIVNADIEYIKSAGVEIQTNKELGKDFTIDDLFNQGYKAIFIATGAYKSIRLGIPNEDAKGVYTSMQVLNAFNLGKMEEIDIKGKVGIIGGGNSAIDAARAILRTGKAESITIYYRRTSAEMPAYEEEIEGGIEEGINIEFLTAPTKIITDNNGRVSACEFVKMKLGERDSSGRRRPYPIEGSNFELKIDTLIAAIGERPDVSYLEKEEGFQISKNGTVIADPENLFTNRKGVFVGGDLVTGPNSVVDAVAAGKIASLSIDNYLKGKEIRREYEISRPSLYVEPPKMDESVESESLMMKYRTSTSSIYIEPVEMIDEDEVFEKGRPKIVSIPLSERKCSFKEVECGLDEEQAKKEAKRCLRCDLETKEGRNFLEKLK